MNSTISLIRFYFWYNLTTTRSKDLLILDENLFIGKGNERACYIHPDDPNKAVKVNFDESKSKQSDTEINYYKQLVKRKLNDWTHLPQYFGEVDTNKGKGFVVELVRDYDGEVSKSFKYYLEQNGLEPYTKELEQYKQYFLDNCIIFNYGMMQGNMLLRKKSETDFELVLIDGLGDVSHFTLPNKIPYFARKRINRRWEKFAKKYLQQKWIDAHRDKK